MSSRERDPDRDDDHDHDDRSREGGRSRERERSPERRRRSRSRSPRRAYDRGDANPGTNLYVRGLGRATTPELRDHFEKVTKIEGCSVVRDPRTNESFGFGFVQVATLDDAERVISELHRSTLSPGSILTVEKAKRARPRSPTPGRYVGRRPGGRGMSPPRRRDSPPRREYRRDDRFERRDGYDERDRYERDRYERDRYERDRYDRDRYDDRSRYY